MIDEVELTLSQQLMLAQITAPLTDSLECNYRGTATFSIRGENAITRLLRYARLRICTAARILTNVQLDFRVEYATADSAVRAFNSRTADQKRLKRDLHTCLNAILDTLDDDFIQSHVSDLIQHLLSCGFKYLSAEAKQTCFKRQCILHFQLSSQDVPGEGICLALTIK